MRPRPSLERLLQALPSFTQSGEQSRSPITAIEIDSRAVRPGALFVALRGTHTDGHRFVADAIAHGAAAVVVEEGRGNARGVAEIVVPDSARALSRLADAFYGSPSQRLRIAGVTGTNGKTTVTHFVGAICTAAGIPTGIIGTVGAQFQSQRWPIANTTPLAPELQALLAAMRDAGAQAVAIEVSSHALALHRADEVRFAAAALTNVTRDHLDFHGTLAAYAAAKRTLFELGEACAFNADDPYGAQWAREFQGLKPVTTYGIREDCAVRANDVQVRPGGSVFRVDGRSFELHVPGRFNVSNALCAIALCRLLHVSEEAAQHGLASVTRVAGRMERIHGGGVDAVIDYAHTPDALDRALSALRETAQGRLMVVFGCGGDRDRGKRPEMGAVASRLADYAYVTSDNPRTEDPEAIIAEIVSGVKGRNYAIEADRRTAIERALRDARPGDVVLVAGKGHENYQVVGSDVLPFDDAAVVREALDRGQAGA